MEEKEEKRFIMTEKDRNEIISLINKRSLIGAKTYLLSLQEESKDTKLKEQEEKNGNV